MFASTEGCRCTNCVIDGLASGSKPSLTNSYGRMVQNFDPHSNVKKAAVKADDGLATPFGSKNAGKGVFLSRTS